MKQDRAQRRVPAVLWVALISLVCMVFLKVVLAFNTKPVILVDAAASGALLVGLYLGYKWAYMLTIAFVTLGTVVGFLEGAGVGLAVFVVDCLVLVPVLLCTSFYFQKVDPAELC